MKKLRRKYSLSEVQKLFMKLPFETRRHLLDVVRRRGSFKAITGNHDAPNPTVNVMATLRRAGFAVVDGGKGRP